MGERERQLQVETDKVICLTYEMAWLAERLRERFPWLVEEKDA